MQMVGYRDGAGRIRADRIALDDAVGSRCEDGDAAFPVTGNHIAGQRGGSADRDGIGRREGEPVVAVAQGRRPARAQADEVSLNGAADTRNIEYCTVEDVSGDDIAAAGHSKPQSRVRTENGQAGSVTDCGRPGSVEA